MTNRTDVQLRALAALVDTARKTIGPAMTELHRRMAEHDGYPSGGDGGRRGGSDLTPVERAANGLLPLDRDRGAIDDAIRSATAEIHRAVTIAGKYAPRIDATALRCTGGQGEPGALEWGRPDCTSIQEADRRGGLCVACRKRRDRWKAGHGGQEAA